MLVSYYENTKHYACVIVCLNMLCIQPVRILMIICRTYESHGNTVIMSSTLCTTHSIHCAIHIWLLHFVLSRTCIQRPVRCLNDLKCPLAVVKLYTNSTPELYQPPQNPHEYWPFLNVKKHLQPHLNRCLMRSWQHKTMLSNKQGQNDSRLTLTYTTEVNSWISRVSAKASRLCDPDGYQRNRTRWDALDRFDLQVTTVASAKSDENRIHRLSPDAFLVSASWDSLSQYR